MCSDTSPCEPLVYLLPPDELYLEFTQVDPKQPERPFGFALQVDGQDRYTGSSGPRDQGKSAAAEE